MSRKIFSRYLNRYGLRFRTYLIFRSLFTVDQRLVLLAGRWPIGFVILLGSPKYIYSAEVMRLSVTRALSIEVFIQWRLPLRVGFDLTSRFSARFLLFQ
jgi:hypothetical protein